MHDTWKENICQSEKAVLNEKHHQTINKCKQWSPHVLSRNMWMKLKGKILMLKLSLSLGSEFHFDFCDNAEEMTYRYNYFYYYWWCEQEVVTVKGGREEKKVL